MREGWAKLLLGNFRPGAHITQEVGVRLEMWQNRRFEDLLRRVEVHRSAQDTPRPRRAVASKRSRQGDARPALTEKKTEAITRMVHEGAYRKAIHALIGESTVVPPEEALGWARKLHPAATKAEALVTEHERAKWDAKSKKTAAAKAAALDAEAREEETDKTIAATWENPLKGLKFGSLKAPGPSGLRPEHIGEMMSVRKRVANKVIRALDKLLSCIQQGKVIEEGRWITYSRTMFIGRQDHDDEPRG